MRPTLSSVCGALTLTLLTASASVAQTTFRSHQSANLPTAAMLNGGSWLFEISHRFGVLDSGSDLLWGIDGPVRNRLGLTYAPHERLMLTVQRSNYLGNLELVAKFRGFAIDGEVPIEVGAQGAVAWNTQVDESSTNLAANETQAYVQVIANALLADRVALGVVPTFLRNPRILDDEPETSFVLGINGQIYFNPTWSFLGEWVVSEERPGLEYDSGTFGFEIRTRGHFFKLLVTNQHSLNGTQVLGGSPADFWDTDSWRFGFNITRLLPF
jgi:hypothetical protein